jgi:hypothetical protein
VEKVTGSRKKPKSPGKMHRYGKFSIGAVIVYSEFQGLIIAIPRLH